MNTDTIDVKFDKAEVEIAKSSFRENKRLGNEVGYYIFDYPAEQELYVRERIEYIRKKNETSGDDYKIVVFDLYEIIIDILNEMIDDVQELINIVGDDDINELLRILVKVKAATLLLRSKKKWNF